MSVKTDNGALRIPLLWVLMILVAGAVALGFIESASRQPFALVELSLLLLALAGLSQLMTFIEPTIARWLLMVGLLALLHWAVWRLRAPHLLGLWPVLVGLAGGVLGVLGAACVALAATGMSWLIGTGQAADPGLIFTALGASWAMVALMAALAVPLQRTLHQAQEYLERAQTMVDRSRDRQVELAQALDDLAHLNRQLLLTTQKLDEARSIAEMAQKLKADFVARVSHELRTPLNMIVGFAEMIMEAPNAYGGNIPQALLADLAIILRNSQHLSSLIDDVLDLSRIDAGQMAITRERASIPAIVEAAAEVVRPLFATKRLYLRTQLADELPLVYCDPTRIREAVVNLLSNAGRFTERGGVEITVGREGPDVTIAVADTGPGIDPQQGRKLFQPFQQLEDALRRRHGGTGLGLAISKSFVELHGGRMWFESELDHGTTFHFSLPIDPPTPVDSNATRWLEPTWEYKVRLTRPVLPQADIKLRLMVLEEGTSLTRLLTRYVDNVELVPVESLAQACEQAATAPVQALLVNAPSVGEALDAVTHSALGALGLAVIVCSVPELRETTDRLGVSDYLLKPVSRELLCQALDQLELAGRTILIVDDEPQELRMFWRMLGAAGRAYRILTATNGEEALRVMREERPDAVLLDLIMPKMDGFQLLQERSRDPLLQGIPVIVLTALDPTAQPIVSSAVAVTQGAGLSVQSFLACVEGLSRLFAAMTAPAPGQPAGRPG